MDNAIAITPIRLDANAVRWAVRLNVLVGTAKATLFVGVPVFVTTLFVLGGV